MPLSVHTKIGIGWFFAISFGLYSFYLSKSYIDGHRYEAMKARERIAKVTDDPKNLKRSMQDIEQLEQLDIILKKLSEK